MPEGRLIGQKENIHLKTGIQDLSVAEVQVFGK